MFQYEYNTTGASEILPIDPFAWAEMIDRVAAFNDEDFGSRGPLMRRPPPFRPAPTTPEEGTNKGLEAITAAVNAAATKEDQLELSCGLPLVFNVATQRYSLAPTAAAIMKFNQENANRPLPKLNLGASVLFAKRTAAAALANPHS
jgi:hypothetical protein